MASRNSVTGSPFWDDMLFSKEAKQGRMLGVILIIIFGIPYFILSVIFAAAKSQK
jgi:hypothetical protein